MPIATPNAEVNCVLAEVDGAPRITELAFNDAVANAAALCPVSNALRGNSEISIDAVLES